MAPVAAGRAQSLSFSATAMAQWTQSRLMLLGTEESVSGPWVGGTAELKVGPVALGTTVLRGTLKPATPGSALQRDGGEIRSLVRIDPVPWIGLEGGFTVRAFSSAAGYQRWNIPSAGIRLAPQLGHPALHGYVRAHYLPPFTQKNLFAGQVAGSGVQWDLGLAAEAGVLVTPRAGEVFGFTYRFERYDFPGGAAGRLDEFISVGVFAGFRIGK